jgi:WD40 repeat protein/tRNA A-37 threonylcarbamoyl transferase component Bud32
MQLDACPTEEELRAFHLGDLPEAQSALIARHLDSCPGCEQAARRLDDLADPMIAALRHLPPTASPEPAGLPQEQTLVGHSPHFSQGALPATVAGYEILSELGRGGMGIVYKARQVQLNRIVALKMIRDAAHASQEERTRFLIEAEMVARLTHPHIVQIHEVGEHDGQPFLALEYVEGGSLAQKLDGRPWQARQAAELLGQLAAAVQHAHERGVLHRDLKPANVLMSASGDPRITDFGLARAVQQGDGLTATGTVLGTPAYMAPEQAQPVGCRAGTAADVYSLGAILYELLAGRPPFTGTFPFEILLRVTTQEPPSLSGGLAPVPRDLATICMRCLEKEPGKRYASAAALAEDLRRFLEGEPILARRVGAAERAVKWARRRPAVAGLLAAVVLVAGAGLGLVLWQWHRAEVNAGNERLARLEIEHLTAGMLLDQGQGLCEKGEVGRGLLSFARALELAGRNEQADLERVARLELALWQEQFFRQRTTFAHAGYVWDAVLAPDGRSVLTAGTRDRTARLRDARTGKDLVAPLRHDLPVWAVAFSPDGRFLASGGHDGVRGEVRFWKSSGAVIGQPLRFEDGVQAVVFSSDSAQCLIVGHKQARLWEAGTARAAGPAWEHGGATLCAGALSGEGRRALTGGDDRTARLWDTKTGRLVATLRHRGPITTVAFSPDSKLALSGSVDGTARLWDASSGAARGELRHRGAVKGVAFRRDSQVVATASDVVELAPEQPAPPGRMQLRRGGGEARVWSVATGQMVLAPLLHPQPVWSIALSPSGQRLLTGCEDGLARLYEMTTGTLVGKPLTCAGTVRNVSFSRDGRQALSACAGNEELSFAYLWEVPAEGEQGRRLFAAGDNINCITFRGDGKALLAGSRDKNAYLVDATGGTLLVPALPHGESVEVVVFAPDGQTFLTADKKGAVRLWSAATGRRLREYRHEERIWLLAFHPDGRTFASADRTTLRVWDVAGQLRGRARTFAGTILAVFFHEGKATALVGRDQKVQVWAVDGEEPLGSWSADPMTRAAVLAADGQLDLSSSHSTHVQLREGLTGRALSRPLMQDRVILCGAVRPGGGVVATSSWFEALRLWDQATGRPLGRTLFWDKVVLKMAFHPDGRVLATADTTVRLWQLPPPVEGAPEEVRRQIERLTGLEILADGTIGEQRSAGE